MKVILESDGRFHIEREALWEKDLDRREAIEDDNWRPHFPGHDADLGGR